MRVIFKPKGTISVKVNLDDLQSDEILTILSRLSLVHDEFRKEIDVLGVLLDVRCMIKTIERKEKINLADILAREKELADKLQAALPDLWDMYKKLKSPIELTIDQYDTVETFALIWLYGFKEQIEAVEEHPTPWMEDTADAYKRLVHAALLRLMEKAPYEREFLIPARAYFHACDVIYWEGKKANAPAVNNILR